MSNNNSPSQPGPKFPAPSAPHCAAANIFGFEDFEDAPHGGGAKGGVQSMALPQVLATPPRGCPILISSKKVQLGALIVLLVIGLEVHNHPSCPLLLSESMSCCQLLLGARSTSSQYTHLAALRPIPVFGCMIVNRADLALKMLKSIDHPVDQVVFVHNADSNPDTNRQVAALIEKLQKGQLNLGHQHVKSVVAFHHDSNLGFSAGVNKIILAAPEAPYWLVVSNDIAFRAGALKEIAAKMADPNDEHSSVCVGTGW